MFTGDTGDFKDTNRLQVKREGNIYYVYSKSKKAGEFILISDKLNFKTEYRKR